VRAREPDCADSTIPPAPTVNPAPVRLANYEVVFVADAGCTDLPPVVRTRTYAGSFNGFRLELSGSEFAAGWNVMSLKLDGDIAYVYAADPLSGSTRHAIPTSSSTARV